MKKYYFLFTVLVLFIAMVVTKFLLGESNRITPFISAALSIVMIINFLHHKTDNLLVTFLGKMSYTIYITHFASIFIYIIFLDQLGFGNHLRITNGYVWMGGVLFCLIMSVPFYYLAEAPGKKILANMRKRRSTAE